MVDFGGYAVGDKVCGRLLWGDGTVVEATIIALDAGISRDAFIVGTLCGNHAVMLMQSIVESEHD